MAIKQTHIVYDFHTDGAAYFNALKSGTVIEITPATFDYFLGVLPPVYMSRKMLIEGAVRIVAMLLTANRRGMIRARAANINHSNSAPGLESQRRKFAVPRLPRWLLPIARASDGAPPSASDCRAWEHRREPQRTVSPQPHPSAESSWSMTILISQTRWPCS